MTPPIDHTTPKFFGRRRGRGLTDALQNAVAQTKDYQLTPDSLMLLLTNNHKPLVLEIGCGHGEHIVHLAATTPDSLFITSEAYENGVAKVCRSIQQQNLKNLYIYPDDVRHILPLLPDSSLDAAYILFPDPWPKKRHRIRRIVPQVLPRLATLLKPEGRFYFASDIPDYVEQTLALALNQGWHWQNHMPEHWQQPHTPAITTSFHKKAIRAGRCSYFLTFTRTLPN